MSEAMKPDEWDYPPEVFEKGKVCLHGGLIRKCDLCHAQYDYAEALRRLRLALKVVEAARATMEDCKDPHCHAPSEYPSGCDCRKNLLSALREFEEGVK